jgi:hypothetical protein
LAHLVAVHPHRSLVDPRYIPGKTITWWSVSSCTADKSVAEGFCGMSGSATTLCIIKTKTAMDISQFSFYSHEKESR